MCEKPAKYTRLAPRIDAQQAAVRRWLRVVVVLIVLFLSVLLAVLLMIDMALPSGLSAGE
jgi:CHASE3 domain sensor protein